MPPLSITFFCPACGIKLTVPSSLAGVTGPCPSCHTQIQAPIPVPQVQPVAAAPAHQIPPPAAQLVQSPSVQTIPPPPQQIAGYPAQPVSVPPADQNPAPAGQIAGQIAGGPAQQSPLTQPILQPSVTVVATEVVPPVLKPEPRQLPNRPHPPEVVAKQMPEPSSSGSSIKSHPIPRHPHKTGIIARFAMMALFLIAAGALFYAVVTFLKQVPGAVNPMFVPAVVKTPPMPPDATKAPDESKQPTGAALPTPLPDQPALIAPAPDVPEELKGPSPAMAALAVMEKFLAANSLAERLPIIESKTPESELTNSCLARPLPPTKSMVIDSQESNPVEGVVDFYYSVDFEAENNRANPQTILVRTRGTGAPKVVVDPFLDLFGGRLAAYAAKPSDKAGIFQVIVSPLASCNDPQIPEREKKLTLKLLARDNTKEITQAYFGKMSKIHEMLEDGTQSLSYGKAKSCTIMLNWNTTDNPQHPYLEAIQLKALDWNP